VKTVFGIMPSRCFQDESRCFGSKHVVFFLTLSQARQTQIIQRPLRRRWAHCPKGKPYLERILQADSFGMFWLYFLVAVSWRQDERRVGTYRNHSEVPYTSYKITRSYEILRVSEYLLTGLQRFADCRCSPKLVG
jgi:hypothetical protein